MNDYTRDSLKGISGEAMVEIILSQQEMIERLNANVESLIEQIRIANSYRFGKHTEKLDQLFDGQISLFDEAENLADEDLPEPEFEEVVVKRGKKRKGKLDEDLKDLPEEVIPTHTVPEEKLIGFFGAGNYRKLENEEYRRLQYVPSSWIVEKHSVEVYVGTGGEHQDEFLRGDRPRDLIPKSIVTHSLGAAIVNGKFVNSLPLNRIEQEFLRNDIHISRQTMSNWIICFSEHYFRHLYGKMKEELLKLHVNQCDETPVQVIRDKSPSGSDKGYMWVHRSGEFYKDKQIVLYEYNKSRAHDVPLEFYKDFHGVLMTDSLSQYHLVAKKLEGLTSANCWAHARRDFADAIKAIGVKNTEAIKRSTAFRALTRIKAIYELEGSLKALTPEERLEERQKEIRPLVEEFFTWVRDALATSLPKGKTAEGLNFCINQEKYLKVFLEDGEVPIDNSASERAIRTFCIGKKNWMFINSVKGANASAVIYSVTESAKLNGLRPYAYLDHLLTELPKLVDKDGNIEEPSRLDALLPWSKDLPEICYKQRRS